MAERCPRCGEPAYIGLRVVECDNPGCEHFRDPDSARCHGPPGPRESGPPPGWAPIIVVR